MINEAQSSCMSLSACTNHLAVIHPKGNYNGSEFFNKCNIKL